MVAGPAERRSSANAGELDPALGGRVDIKAYYSGGLRYKHIEPVPQSGFRRMSGTWDCGPVRPRLDALAASNIAESLGPHTGTQTIWSADVAGDVAAIYATISADAGEHSVVAEVEAGGEWTQIGPAFLIDGTARPRTFAVAPCCPIENATGVRLVVTFDESATIALADAAVLAEGATQDYPRYAELRHDSGDRYFLSVTRQWLDIFEGVDFVAGLYLPTLGVTRLPEVGFYTENATIGIFHRDMRTLRIRRAGAADLWEQDDWPYDGVPTTDLGGEYAKSNDVWEVFFHWADNAYIYCSLIIDGEQTPAVPLPNSTDGEPVLIGSADGDDWDQFALDLQAALRDLPSLGNDVTVTQQQAPGNQRLFTFTFGGDLAGREYQLDAQITNTTFVSALAFHRDIGETDFEPMLSASAGWPGGAALAQDRLDYFDLKAVPAANLLSQAGEYFNVNIQAAAANAARLDKLRAGQTAERVLAVKDSVYLLLFTDQAVHFAANRTISREEPLNFTITAETGIVANTAPIELESRIYYVAHNDDEEDADGHQILSLKYDELNTSFEALPESLLASHVIRGVMRSKRQRSTADQDASRMWLLRQDGRLIVAQVIRSEDILGFCEWLCPASGLVREIGIDASNRARLCVERDGELRHEREDRSIFLQAALETTCDMAGQCAGLDIHEGRQVWAVAEGYRLGPFTVSDGAIDLGDPYNGTVLVGLWTPPVFESMPFYRILPGDRVLKRPGRIHTVHMEIIDTDSIAVGANGEEAENVSLLDTGDPVNQAPPKKSGPISVSGLLGAKTGTTLVITQTRPGELRVRDYLVEEAL